MKKKNEGTGNIQVWCNCCGKEITSYEQIDKADYIHVKKDWGYFSEKDGMNYTFDLCEDCVEKLDASFVIPIERSERIIVMEEE